MPSDAFLAEVSAWLDAAPNRELTGDFQGLALEPMRAVLQQLPPVPAPVTIAGTKGKGSTLRLVETGLRALGRTTVAFTSPHVRHLTERWRYLGSPASSALLADATHLAAAAEARAGVALTWFERSLAIAVALTGMQRPDHLLLEVGIGGWWDATNALDAGVAVVTHLSYDHRDVLGPTLAHIARQKLGIARPHRPLLIGPQTPAAAAAVDHVLATGVVAGAEVRQIVRQHPWALALPGDHQHDNAATAAAVLDVLVPGWDRAPVAAAWATVRLPARCQRVEVGGRPMIIDGAHNGPSVAATLRVAAAALPTPFTVVLGLARDKEAEDIITAMQGQRVVRCAYGHPRSRDEATWPAAARSWPWYANIHAALAAEPGPLCITGSFYLAADALAALQVPPDASEA